VITEGLRIPCKLPLMGPPGSATQQLKPIPPPPSPQPHPQPPPPQTAPAGTQPPAGLTPCPPRRARCRRRCAPGSPPHPSNRWPGGWGVLGWVGLGWVGASMGVSFWLWGFESWLELVGVGTVVFGLGWCGRVVAALMSERSTHAHMREGRSLAGWLPQTVPADLSPPPYKPQLTLFPPLTSIAQTVNPQPPTDPPNQSPITPPPPLNPTPQPLSPQPTLSGRNRSAM